MTYQIQIPRKVEREIEVIIQFIESQSQSSAARWATACEKAIENLKTTPETHPLAPEDDNFDDREIRQVLFKTRKGKMYRILFEIDATWVRLLAVRGPGQDVVSPDQL